MSMGSYAAPRPGAIGVATKPWFFVVRWRQSGLVYRAFTHVLQSVRISTERSYRPVIRQPQLFLGRRQLWAPFSSSVCVKEQS